MRHFRKKNDERCELFNRVLHALTHSRHDRRAGFAYDHWLQYKGDEHPFRFFPTTFKSKDAQGMHKYYADRLPCVEINATFYNYMKREVFESWANLSREYEADTGGYAVVLKANKYFT